MKRAYLLVGAILLVAALTAYWAMSRSTSWGEEDTAALRSLWIGSLPALPPDPSNAYADDPDGFSYLSITKVHMSVKRLDCFGKASCWHLT